LYIACAHFHMCQRGHNGTSEAQTLLQRALSRPSITPTSDSSGAASEPPGIPCGRNLAAAFHSRGHKVTRTPQAAHASERCAFATQYLRLLRCVPSASWCAARPPTVTQPVAAPSPVVRGCGRRPAGATHAHGADPASNVLMVPGVIASGASAGPHSSVALGTVPAGAIGNHGCTLTVSKLSIRISIVRRRRLICQRTPICAMMAMQDTINQGMNTT